MFSNIKQKMASLFKGRTPRDNQYISPLAIDTELAIHELNALVHNDTDAVELYIALASLYRVQGDIEKALQIHARLLVRNDISTTMKSRLYAELGKDYKRAGLLDRAIASYMQAQELGYVNTTFYYDMIDVYDMLGEYDKAILIAKKMKDSLCQAYFLVKLSMHQSALIPPTKQSIELILDISAELAQAWVLLLCLHSNNLDTISEFRSVCIKALNYIPVPFLLFELYIISTTFQQMSVEEKKIIVETIASLLQEKDDDFLLLYYLGLFYRSIDDTYNAIVVFEKSLSLKEDFWATQYELFSLATPSFTGDDVFKKSITFFLKTGKNVNRFVCSVCSLQLNSVFSMCPRCKHIQTICFRTTL